MVQASPLEPRFHARIEAVKPKLRKACDFIQKGYPTIIPKVGHTANRLLIAAKAFGLCGLVLDDPQLKESSRLLVKAALERRDKDGVFIERGGRDSSYNAVSILMGTHLSLYLPNPELEAAFKPRHGVAENPDQADRRGQGRREHPNGRRQGAIQERRSQAGELRRGIADALVLWRAARRHQRYRPGAQGGRVSAKQALTWQTAHPCSVESVRRATKGGATLKILHAQEWVHDKIREGGYDVVILQEDIPELTEHSVAPVFEHARLFNQEIRAAGGQTVLFVSQALRASELGYPQEQIAQAHRDLGEEPG